MGDGVTDCPPQETKRWGDVFEEQAPFYLSIGMTADEYWRGYPRLAREYREAYKLKMQRDNSMAWLSGMYVAKAIEATICNAFLGKGKKPNKYPDEPFALTDEERAARQERKIQEFEDRLLTQFKLQGGGASGRSAN